jgi:putative sterol carrier protein
MLRWQRRIASAFSVRFLSYGGVAFTEERTNREVEMAEEDAVTAGIGEADATQLAALVGSVPDEQLAEGMADPEGRKMVLDEIFKRMADHVEADKIRGIDAVVHFTITGAPGGGSDTYEAVIRDGKIDVSSEPTVEHPKVRITTAPVSFLKLVTGQQSGPVMFMTGKLKLDGDVMFAARLTSFFRIPSASE